MFYFYWFSILEGLTCTQIDKLDIFNRICVICNPFYPCVGRDNVKLNFAAFIKLSAIYQAQSISAFSHYMPVSHSSWDVSCKMKNAENYLRIRILSSAARWSHLSTRILKHFNPYPTAFPYGNGMVLHFYQQQESSTTKTVHKVINKGLKTYV